ncbi:hypothetical protein AB1Y20_022105 [Prymnesium parvum]|uniref:Uncharacterized protein n=1 Tax=Prymnesium parvum TaxID=97485 RepID=A0AB34JHV1_PRYPA
MAAALQGAAGRNATAHSMFDVLDTRDRRPTGFVIPPQGGSVRPPLRSHAHARQRAASVPWAARQLVDRARQQAHVAMCRRHPRACQPAPRENVAWSNGSNPLHPPIAASALPQAERSLHELSRGWCLSRDGCIASSWSEATLPQPQRRWLLSSRRGAATSCFDELRPSRFAAERCPPNDPAARLSPSFEGEFGFELLHALPFLYWLRACGLLGVTSACTGMEPFYSFSEQHHVIKCGTRPTRSRWRLDSMPAGTADGWSWRGRKSLRYYAYPSGRWVPPPLHSTYRELPLRALRLATEKASDAGAPSRWVRRAWVQNKFYPEGHGTADNFWSLEQVRLILDTLLGCGVQVLYNHPQLEQLPAPDENDLGRPRLRLGDLALIESRYNYSLRNGSLVLLPQLAQASKPLSYNEVQLRAAAKTRCFLAPQGGASYLTFYQPGFHVVSDTTGKERCVSSLQATGGGTYWHFYTLLPGRSGESVIYNVGADRTRLKDSLLAMCSTSLCEEPSSL